MKRRPAKVFQKLIVWQKAHQFVFIYLIPAKNLGYGNTSLLMTQLEEVSKLLEVYTASILDSGS